MRTTGRLLLAAILLLAGGFLVWWGLPKEATLPMPERNISEPSAEPTGPTEAVVDGVELSASDMEPNTLLIPAIESYSSIEDRGLDNKNWLDLPTDVNTLARYTRSAPIDADEGNTMMAGHVTYNNDNGSLYNLATMEAGQIAFLKPAGGEVQKFKLVSLTAYVKSELPDSVWQSDGPRTLTVITCGGPVEHTSHGRSYRDNLVAVFTPVEA